MPTPPPQDADAIYPYDAGLSPLIEAFVADRDALFRRYPLSRSPRRRERYAHLIEEYQDRLAGMGRHAPTPVATLDITLFENHLCHEASALAIHARQDDRLFDRLPFSEAIIELDRALMDMEELDARAASATLDGIARCMAKTEPRDFDPLSRAWWEELKTAVERWKGFYAGYDPVIDWWIRQPLEKIFGHFERLSEKPNEDEVKGSPVGREALEADLAFEMIPYTPEELIAMGEREYEWCRKELDIAAREIGCDDWKTALEVVKDTAVAPGGQPSIVRDMAREAITYVEPYVTVPPLAKDVWRMTMMSAAAQKTNPFFLGGEAIVVSYPTDAMTHEEKRMSMRGNNPNFSRATVQHELIPGHHLQMFMMERYRPYRRLFWTPFWIEGWTIYWEFLLWELGFPRTPEEKIGMLFWRMHRCVRVVFSLRFHLGELSPQECVDMLVNRCGHERLNAEGEVRRSFNGLYPPLYQAAYLIGGLQFRAISRELRDLGWTYCEIHDAMLQENTMPPALMRLAILGRSPREESPMEWRFDSVREKIV